MFVWNLSGQSYTVGSYHWVWVGVGQTLKSRWGDNGLEFISEGINIFIQTYWHLCLYHLCARLASPAATTFLLAEDSYQGKLMWCRGMFPGPLCHSKWLPILIYTLLSCWQHLHMSTHHVNLIKHAHTGCYYSAAWDRHVSMFMIYIHSHTQGRRPFFHLGRLGLQRGPVVGEAAEEPKGRGFHLLQRRDTLFGGVSWMHAIYF